MGIEIGHYPEEDRLDLTFEGRLDLTLTSEMVRACDLVDKRMQVCVIDSTRITRVFDSGIGLLLLLLDRLRDAGVTLIMIGEIPGLNLERQMGVDGVRPRPGELPGSLRKHGVRTRAKAPETVAADLLPSAAGMT